MSLFGNSSIWYTDQFDVYRVIDKKNEKNITIQNKELLSKNNRGRIYKKTNSIINKDMSAGTYDLTENFITEINIDIKRGDYIKIRRGFYINKQYEEEIEYLVNGVVDYYEPFGGINANLQHKEIILTKHMASN